MDRIQKRQERKVHGFGMSTLMLIACALSAVGCTSEESSATVESVLLNGGNSQTDGCKVEVPPFTYMRSAPRLINGSGRPHDNVVDPDRAPGDTINDDAKPKLIIERPVLVPSDDRSDENPWVRIDNKLFTQISPESGATVECDNGRKPIVVDGEVVIVDEDILAIQPASSNQ